MSVLKRISLEKVLAAAQIVWLDKSVADEVALDAVDIVNRTYTRKFSFFNGKSFKCLVGGLFYLLGFKHGAKRSQTELADKLGTTDVTIRTSYRQWLEEFPDLFLDVIGKFADDYCLRNFVLLDLRQNVLQSQTSGH